MIENFRISDRISPSPSLRRFLGIPNVKQKLPRIRDTSLVPLEGKGIRRVTSKCGRLPRGHTHCLPWKWFPLAICPLLGFPMVPRHVLASWRFSGFGSAFAGYSHRTRRRGACLVRSARSLETILRGAARSGLLLSGVYHTSSFSSIRYRSFSGRVCSPTKLPLIYL